MKYIVKIEKGPECWGAYVPELPDCVAAGESREEVIETIKSIIEMYIEDMKGAGSDIEEATELEFVDT